MRPHHLFGLSALALAAVALTGCGGGDGLDRQAVSGTVTFEGQPLQDGMIQFLPADPSSETPVSGGAPIKGGAYSIDHEVGLVPGKYNVSISSASSEIDLSAPPGSGAALPKEAIPPKYNQNSTLAVEVKSGQSNTFDFQLTK